MNVAATGKPSDPKPVKKAAAKTASAKSVPSKATSSKGAPAKAKPSKAMPAKANPAKTTPAKASPAKTAPAEAESDKAAVAQKAKPASAVPPRVQALADALVDAQTRFWMQNFKGRQLERFLKDEWPHVEAALENTTLRQAISEEKVRAIAHRYALEMEISGGILELAGDMAALVFQSPRNRKTRLRDVLSDRAFDEMLEKTFESGGVLDRTTARIRESEAFRTLLSDLVLTVLKGSLSSENKWRALGGVRKGARVLKDWIGDKAPELTESLEESARRWVDGGMAGTVDLVIALLEHDRYRDTAMDGISRWWDRVKDQPVSQIQGYLSQLDLQEYIVVGYEFWLEFRQSPYMRSIIDGAIGLFYRKYGDHALKDIIEEMGLSSDYLESAVHYHAGDVAHLLLTTGLAESFIRRQLTNFYESEAGIRVLSGEA